MADGVTIQLKGDKDCVAAFLEFREFIRGNLFSQSVRAAALLMLDEIIARAPVLTGRLVSNLRVQTRRSSGSGEIHGQVVVNTGSGDQNAYYWYFVEFGHRMPEDKGGEYVQPHPFVTPSYEARNADAAQQVIDKFSEGLDKAESRARRAGAL